MLFSRLSLPLILALAVLAACGPADQPAATTPPPKPKAPGPNIATLADSAVAPQMLAYLRQYPGSEVLFKTRLGNIRVKLYDDTPIHRANFLLLTRRGVFDETVFNRVVKGFAVQGGQSLNRTIRLHRYRLPPEIRPGHFHFKGALGMARYDDEKNPGHLSSNTDFYFVVGEKLVPFQAKAAADRPLTPAQIKTYSTLGGVPSLDGKYTVFGEVTEGLEVVEAISKIPVDPQDKWPINDVAMKVEVVK
ncbi:peptidylprolyl isomerase [Hymenobacter sp. HMF4947]|uniref:Peptidyl-prolyl cis-trans isomerase n=1 Tax=Hymenobacter ginkgonis TaxID=2682976 RepID=A0A7K1TAJ9_9BACT|nr:peptidylprolyl isomerase [Hymenobacter ginkgonis]MVN75424.1 peptidylprolyl isomerase [Hymenobacter ginkgonis]